MSSDDSGTGSEGRSSYFVSVVAVATLLLGLLVPAGASAKSSAPALRIVSPARDELVTARHLTVRVKVAPGVTHLRLRVAGRPLTIKKGAGTRGVRVASAAIKGLPRGRVAVTVAGRHHGYRVSDYRPVVLGQRSPKLLRGVRLPRRSAGSVRLKLRLGEPVSAFEVTVDGRRARLLHRPDGPAPSRPAVRVLRRGRPVNLGKRAPAPLTTIPLSADDGLHPGRNRVVVLAYRAKSGNWDRVTRSVWMRRRAPLVAAGPDRRVGVGATVRLDGRNSRPSGPGEDLDYQWRIVAQPRLPSSAPPAHLIDPHAVRPRLAVHRPGAYKVALGVGGDARADVTTVEAASAVPPYGLRISTDQNGRMEPAGNEEEEEEGKQVARNRTTIEGLSFGSHGEGESAETSAEGVLLVDLNRSTLAVEAVETFKGSEVPGAIAKAEERAGENDLVIVSGKRRAEEKEEKEEEGEEKKEKEEEKEHEEEEPKGGGGEEEGGGVGRLNAAVKVAPEIPEFDGFTVVLANHHVVAYNVGKEIGDGPEGAISGRLRPQAGSHNVGLFTFAYPETIEFDTYVEKGEGVVMEAAGHSMTVSSGSGQGIAMMALNPAFEPISEFDKTYELKGNSEDTAALTSLGESLSALAKRGTGSVLLLQTWGSPKNDVPEWSAIGQLLEGFGGTPAVWDELNGEGNYALVGAAYPGQETTALREASTAEASGPMEGAGAVEALKKWVGTQRGILGRGTNSLPIVRASTSLPKGGEETERFGPYELPVLVESAPKPWPLSDPAHEAALVWISEQLKLGRPGEGGEPSWCFRPEKPDLRVAYCNETLVGQWQAEYLPEMKNLTMPEGSQGFNAAQLAEMVEELASEFKDIAKVHAMIALLKEPYANQQGSLSIDFVTGGQKVEREVVEPEEGSFHTGISEAIFDSVLTPAQDAEFDTGEEVAEAGATDGASVAFGVMEGLLNLGYAIAEAEDGGPAASPFNAANREAVVLEAKERLGAGIHSLNAMEDEILTDWTKLTTTGEKAQNIWGLNAKTIAKLEENVTKGAEAWFYEAMIPGSYGQMQVVPREGVSFGNLKSLECSLTIGSEPIFEEWEPFKGVSESGVYSTGSSYWVIGNPQSKYLQVPSGGLTEDLFKRTGEEGGIGIAKSPFFTWAWYGRRTDLSEYFQGRRKGLGRPQACKGS
jgi:hypothetical protein